MFHRKLAISSFHCALVTLGVATLALTACSERGDSGAPRASLQGTVSLESIKVGAPESVFKESVLTFVPKENLKDPKASEYMSRTFNQNGGQMVARCIDGQCDQIFIYHVEKPIDKKLAEASMQNLMPSNAGQSVKTTRDSKNPKNPTDYFDFANGYRGCLIYANEGGTDVISVGARLNRNRAGDGAPLKSDSGAATKAADVASEDKAQAAKSQ